jgi:hypothetical protein
MSIQPNLRVQFVGLALLCLLVLTSCDRLITPGSGSVVEREFQLADFDQVSIENAFRGTVQQGETFSVIVRIDDNLEQQLKVEQNGSQLTIGLDPQVATTRSTLEYEIVTPALEAVNASGASVIQLSGFTSSENFSVEASGASRVEGDITTGDMDATASGASTIRLNGSGNNLQADASGASTIDLENFIVNDVNANASGASRVNVNAGGQLDAEASGASTIRYSGNPILGTVREDGGSTVQSR